MKLGPWHADCSFALGVQNEAVDWGRKKLCVMSNLEPNKLGPMKLGQYLVSRRKISNSELEAALSLQKVNGSRLGQCLISIKAIDEPTLYKALARLLRVGFLDLKELDAKDIDKNLLDLIDYDDAFKFQAVPLQIRELNGRRRLVVATSNPAEIEFYDNLEFKVGMHIIKMLTTPSNIEWFLQNFYHKGGHHVDVSAQEKFFLECYGMDEFAYPEEDEDSLAEMEDLDVENWMSSDTAFEELLMEDADEYRETEPVSFKSRISLFSRED